MGSRGDTQDLPRLADQVADREARAQQARRLMDGLAHRIDRGVPAEQSGRVAKWLVEEKAQVAEGQALLVLEG